MKNKLDAKWSESACLYYAKEAMRRRKVPETEMYGILNEMMHLFDRVDVEEAGVRLLKESEEAIKEYNSSKTKEA